MRAIVNNKVKLIYQAAKLISVSIFHGLYVVYNAVWLNILQIFFFILHLHSFKCNVELY